MHIILLLLFIISCNSNTITSTEKQNENKLPDTPDFNMDTTVAIIEPIDESTEVKPTPEFTVDYIMGHFDPAKHPDFVVVEVKHADREGLYLRKDTYEAFRKMYDHALKDGVRLQIRSATRNFNYQKGIWESKWTGEKLIEGGENLAQTTPDAKQRALKILRYSSMPGSSRHHWGTDFDLNSFDNSWFEAGEGLNIYTWLSKHAHEYGFCQPYSAGRTHGYLEERWHWTYMPVAKKLTALARTELKNEMIKGFKGSETAVMIDVVKNYVLGINEKCM